jgi:hypothetical protein
MVRPFAIGVSSLLLCVIGAGCGGGELVPVQGTVKLDGKPLAGVSVLFLAQGADGRNATGFTDTDGVFRLSTLGREDGAMPGKYKVVIQPPAAASNSRPTATPDEAQKTSTEVNGKPAQRTVSIPVQYSRPDQTVLVQQVPPEGAVFFELQSSPP